MPLFSRPLAFGALIMLAACSEAEPDSPAVTPTAPAPAVVSTTPAPAAADTPPAADADGNSLVQPAQVTRSGGWQHYGTSFVLADDAAMDCQALIDDVGSHVDKTVRVKGRVADVCQKKGCWMVITPLSGDAGDTMIRVTMKDHAFAVDMQGAGKETELEGLLVKKDIDPETVAHYESEAGNSAAVPEKLNTPAATYELVASAVRIRN